MATWKDVLLVALGLAGLFALPLVLAKVTQPAPAAGAWRNEERWEFLRNEEGRTVGVVVHREVTPFQ